MIGGYDSGTCHLIILGHGGPRVTEPQKVSPIRGVEAAQQWMDGWTGDTGAKLGTLPSPHNQTQGQGSPRGRAALRCLRNQHRLHPQGTLK